MSHFIIIEGPDFSGKSTQIDMIDRRELYKDHNVFFTREPGSFLPESEEKCEEIREQILFGNNTLIEEANLFAESRYIHTQEIVDILTRYDDAVVISDRYIISSLAYQGYAQGLDKDVVYELNKPSLDLLNENNITIHCIKFVMPEEEWERRRNLVMISRDLDEIEKKDISKEVYEFFNNDEIFFNWTNGLNMKVYEVNAENNKETVYKEFKNIIDIIREDLLWH
jgi:dTMP kinase